LIKRFLGSYPESDRLPTYSEEQKALWFSCAFGVSANSCGDL
jgi:hypothetical protein